MGLYHVCSNGHGPVVFGVLRIFWFNFWAKSKKNLIPVITEPAALKLHLDTSGYKGETWSIDWWP